MLKTRFQQLIALDLWLSNWVIGRRDSRVQRVFRVVTYLGSGYVWAVVYLCLFVLASDQTKVMLRAVVLAELLGLLVIIVLRNLIKRERPSAKVTSLLPLPWQGNSFPSHHALRVSMLTTLFGTAYPLCLPFLVFSATVVAMSRIYLARHYPFDVLAGAFLGFLCARLALFVYYPAPSVFDGPLVFD